MRGLSSRIGRRLFLAAISGLLLLPAAPASAAAKPWPSDLDFSPLASRLSEDASLVDAAFADFARECLPEYKDKPFPARTNHALVDRPSGTCVDNLYCAYERCYPRPDGDGHAGTALATRLADTAGAYAASWEDLSEEVRGWLEDPDNPALNLPSKVVFPAVASDVVAAVNFARENGLEVSVKNSGHSFMGASTKRDTLHVNMNRFQRYAPTGIVGCDGEGGDASDDPACKLAAARGKPGYIRVGGGENWDKTYRAVGEFNLASEGDKYHVVGGAAGTVSPMGWTFQGGLAGTTNGRSYGFGVDQILQLEMVLPNGLHVRFGPAEWEDASADGYVVPKTTSVGGLCRTNPDEADEEKWEWRTCPDDAGVDFDDLWFAVSGGGGGTWGVVTSIYLQLHDHVPSSTYGYFADGADCDAIGGAFIYIFEAFRARYFLAPSTLNVTRADSDACGSPDGAAMLVCFGEGPLETMLDAWKSFLTDNQDQLPAEVTVDQVVGCGTRLDVPYQDIVTFAEGPYAGKIQDSPPPTIQSGAGNDESQLNVLLPREGIEGNIDQFLQTIIYTSAPGAVYYAFGSGTAAASDQANSLSAAHRGAGAKVYLPPDVFFAQTFPLVYDLSDESDFPAFLGSNHAGNNMMGPLKDDWTKACPMEWTQAERDEKCVSVQEAIYGTKTLKRLEAIKEALDPDYVFDCQGCIGNNRAKDAPNAPAKTNPDSNDAYPDLKEVLSDGNEDSAAFDLPTDVSISLGLLFLVGQFIVF